VFNVAASASGQTQDIQLAGRRTISEIMALGLRQFPREMERLSQITRSAEEKLDLNVLHSEN
jgi:hypothetical protein